jgi:hypothetical protein
MEFVSKLHLDEAEDVIESKTHEFPVPLIPVQDGLKCESQGCFHLCVSEKRMKSHWLSVHGRPGQDILDWTPAPLQTFFRGNLLRYFTKDEPTKGPPIYTPNAAAIPFILNYEVHRPTVLDESDTVLLGHFIASTSVSIAHDKQSQTVWQCAAPKLAYRDPFLMHGILACSALHLAYKNPTEEGEYLIKASTHQDIAMPLFRSAIAKVDEQNCHSILVFSHLLVIYSFALESQDERLLLAETSGPDVLPSWLHFLRNGCLTVCSVWDVIESGPVKDLASQWEVPVKISEDGKLPLTDYLLSVIPSQSSPDAWPEDVCRLYFETAVELAKAFSYTRALGERFTTWDALRLWPMLISVEYMNLLSSWHPGALILLAHYCILLQKVECRWYFEGRSTKLLSTIMKHLDVRWHCYIRWPLEEIRIQSITVI